MVVRQLEVIAFASSHLTFVCDAFVPWHILEVLRQTAIKSKELQ
jgi:hypothetical protein